MVILGVLLIGLGVAAILAAWFTGSGQSIIGIDLVARESFIAGAIAGAFILWGFTILKYGTRRSIHRRRERRELGRLQAKVDRAEGNRQSERNEEQIAREPRDS